MSPAAGRRGFVRLLAGAAGCAAFERHAFAQHAALATTRLGDILAVISGGGGNVVVAAGPDGLVVVNGGARAHSAGLLAELATQFPGATVKTLFNTDWHPDHSGSNELMRSLGAAVIAHEHTKQYLARTLPKSALPTRTFYTSGKITFGADTIEYGQLGQAHTDGDIYVHFRGQNVLAAGDLLSVGAYPIADFASGGWLGGMVTATKTILDMTGPQTRFVPGTGPVLARADVEAQHQMLLTLRDRIGKMMRQGLGADDMLAAGVTKEYDARWGDPREFLNASYRGMWLHVRELGGVV
jgi:glyoxylase-like metal-dependent hydrolase (beta-lactamase superfamily II)